MSVILSFESQFFDGKIEGFENARRYYANASTTNKNASKLPKKVSSLFIN